MGKSKFSEFIVGLFALFRDKVFNSIWTWRILVVLLIAAILFGVYIGTGGINITLRLGTSIAEIGGQTIVLSGTPTLIDGNLYIPTRSLFEAIGANVLWDQAAGRVFISMPKTIIRY